MDIWTTYREESSWNVTATVQPTVLSVYTSQIHVIVIASLTIIIGLLGMIGNLLVFLAVSLSKGLQNSTNVFVVSLSISDFISAASLPFQGVSVLSETGWPFGKGMCDLFGVIFIWMNPTSELALTAIAVNRYIVITKSKRLQQKIYTRSGNAVMVALLWLFPLLVLVTPQVIPATGGIVYDPIYRSCLWDIDHPLALVFQSIASVIFTCCTFMIFFCYIAIYFFIRRHLVSTRDRLRASNDSLTTDSPSVKQINITKNLALVVVIFLVCVLPYTLNLYVPSRGLYAAYLAVLLILPTCLNPVIYAARHPSFKAVFKCMFSCRLKDIPHQSEWLKVILHSSSATHSSRQSSSVV